MPSLYLNMDALMHNLRQIPHLEKQWGFGLLPVLKMAAGYPPIVDALRQMDYRRYGVTEVDEIFLWSSEPPCRTDERPVLISLPPPQRADDVVRLFSRSPVSSLDNLSALEAAARRMGSDTPLHEYLIMLDIGEWREGIPLQDAVTFFQAAAGRFPHLRAVGIGVTLGCLHGVCPNHDSMRALADAVLAAEEVYGHPLTVVSLGGSVFWDWLAENHANLPFPSHCTVELRAADPILLGYDSYHDKAAAGGTFHRDLFRLEATVVEVQEKNIRPARLSVLNGMGQQSTPRYSGRRRRALLDCGCLHTDLEHCRLLLPEACVADYSATYCVIDVTDCPVLLRPGDTVSFVPGYWAVARSIRTPLVQKYCLPLGQTHSQKEYA